MCSWVDGWVMYNPTFSDCLFSVCIDRFCNENCLQIKGDKFAQFIRSTVKLVVRVFGAEIFNRVFQGGGSVCVLPAPSSSSVSTNITVAFVIILANIQSLWFCPPPIHQKAEASTDVSLASKSV